MSQSPTSPTNPPRSAADTWSIMMEAKSAGGEETAEEGEKDKRAERSWGGGPDEGGGSPRKRRRTSTDTESINAPLQSPLEPIPPSVADLPRPPFVPYNPARRTPTTAIAALINSPPSDIPALPNNPPPSDPPFRRPTDLESLVSVSKGPASPARSRATPSPALPSLFLPRSTSYPPPPSSITDLPRHTSSSHLPIPIPPGRDGSPRPESRPGIVPWAADQGRSSIRPLSLSPIAAPEQSRHFLSTSVPTRTTPLSTDPPPPRRGSAATDPVRADDRPLFFAMLDSPPLRERSLPPIRRAVSSGPSQPERRGSPSRNASRAWFSLGPMEAVDMRQWDQYQREAYQRGYTDALKAVQRGTMGVAGAQYPYPQLLRGDEALPAEEGYDEIGSRRPSLTDASRSFYPEASARNPQASSSSSSQHWLPHGRPQPPRYPSSQFFEPAPPHHQSTSAWADDRRAEYARYEYTVPPPAQHQSKPALRPATPGGPYCPAPHPRSYTYQDHPTYGSNPTTTTATTTSTSPSQITRGGQRQLISCYPCRSRKMKCDGTKPCFQCVRRGGEAECEFAMTVRRRGKGKKAPSSRSNKSQSGTDGEGDAGESGQESGDERWRMEGMNLPDVGEET